LNALSATAHFESKIKGLGVTQSEFLRAALFIETELPALVAKGKYHLSQRETRSPLVIEYDPVSRRSFMQIDGRKGAQLGKGKKKIVTRSILYSSHPQVVAKAEQDMNMDRELAVTKLLQGAPGLFDTKGFAQHTENGKKMSTIYSVIYNAGSMQNVYDTHQKFSIWEKAKMALNILRGIESLHTRGIVHRDLGARNYLANIPSGKIGKRDVVAVIADLGRADYAAKAAGSKVQGNTTYTSPEGLFSEKMKGPDYFKSDIFAVGCVLYQLFYDSKAAWQDHSYVKDTTKPLKARYEDMVSRIDHATRARRQALHAKAEAGKLVGKEAFEFVVLQMLNPNPSERPSATQLRKQMESAFNRL
ncbi:MAG TPA: protein kinase, partial [Chlamydiales bacterium]|nr:protein kinase [Chlamydiales bacterium]